MADPKGSETTPGEAERRPSRRFNIAMLVGLLVLILFVAPVQSGWRALVTCALAAGCGWLLARSL